MINPKVTEFILKLKAKLIEQQDTYNRRLADENYPVYYRGARAAIRDAIDAVDDLEAKEDKDNV